MWNSEPFCEREADIRRRVRANADDPEIHAHAANCDVCRETLAVAAWMQQLAAQPVDAEPRANASYLWWRAEVLRRQDAARAAVNPLEIGERVQVGIGLIGAVTLLMWLWRQSQPLSAPGTLSSGLTIAMITAGVLVAITAVFAALEVMAAGKTR